ncbi:hypothetical protein J3F83DRAFT_161636 [Trichoderma novae-zelandiae]
MNVYIHTVLRMQLQERVALLSWFVRAHQSPFLSQIKSSRRIWCACLMCKEGELETLNVVYEYECLLPPCGMIYLSALAGSRACFSAASPGRENSDSAVSFLALFRLLLSFAFRGRADCFESLGWRLHHLAKMRNSLPESVREEGREQEPTREQLIGMHLAASVSRETTLAPIHSSFTPSPVRSDPTISFAIHPVQSTPSPRVDWAYRIMSAQSCPRSPPRCKVSSRQE